MRFVVKPSTSSRITAAEDDEFDFDKDMDSDSLTDNISDITDTVNDIQDAIEDDNPKETILDIHNNIENHYIAECERCHEIFISAMTESDTPVESIKGECPVCHEQTTQDIKWIVRSIDNRDSEE